MQEEEKVADEDPVDEPMEQENAPVTDLTSALQNLIKGKSFNDALLGSMEAYLSNIA